jgi:hypothetical protein
VRSATPLAIESPVPSSLISSGGNRSTTQFPALPGIPRLAGDAQDSLHQATSDATKAFSGGFWPLGVTRSDADRLSGRMLRKRLHAFPGNARLGRNPIPCGYMRASLPAWAFSPRVARKCSRGCCPRGNLSLGRAGESPHLRLIE